MMIFHDGRVYDGEWKKDGINGRGVMRCADGNVYDGMRVDGNRHGQGKQTLSNGDVYTGSWENDERHGQGTYRWTGGNVYTGSWEKGNRHGQGQMTNAVGSTWTGEWQDDKFWNIDFIGGFNGTRKKYVKGVEHKETCNYVKNTRLEKPARAHCDTAVGIKQRQIRKNLIIKPN